MTDGITLITGERIRKSGICHEKGGGEQRRPLYLCGGRRKTRFADAFNAEAILNLHMYIRRMITDPDESGLRTEYPAGNEENWGQGGSVHTAFWMKF